MSVATIGLVVGAGVSVYSAYSSARKTSKANQLAAKNIRPVFSPSGEIKQVFNVAAGNLDNDYVADFAARQLQQGQASGIDAILKSGGTADYESINAAYGKELQQSLSQLIMDRDKKIATFSNAAYNVAASNDASFQYNQDAPYKDIKQAEAALRQEGAAAGRDAINGVISTVSNYGTATMQAGQYGRRGSLEGNNNLDRVARADPSFVASARNTALPGAGPSAGAMAAAGRTGLVNPAQGLGDNTGYIIGYDDFGDPVYGG